MVPALAAAATVPPAGCTLTASQTTITRGQNLTLSWTTTNATKVRLTIDGGSIDVGTAGTRVVAPRGSRPYYLSVTNKVPGVGASFTQCVVWITVNNPTA